MIESHRVWPPDHPRPSKGASGSSWNPDHTGPNDRGANQRLHGRRNLPAPPKPQFKQFNGAEVKVLGWPKLAPAVEQGKWIEKYSDHALLYLEVQKV